MPADNLVWLIDHFSRFDGGADPVLAVRFYRSLWREAGRHGLEPADLLDLADEHRERAVAEVPDAVPLGVAAFGD